MKTAPRTVLAGCVALLWAFAATSSSSAQSLEQTSSFWREIRQPGFARSEELIDQGIRFLIQLGGAPTAEPMAHASLRSAILRFEHAVSVAPQSRRAWFYLGYSLSRFERYDPTSDAMVRRDEEALGAFEHLQELDPLFRVEEVGFELGILNTRVGRFDAAVREYQRSIQYALSRANTAVTFSNMAEVRMMSGDLIGAVRDYERAVHTSRLGGNVDARGLPLFGLAVALDRLGETVEARSRALEAVGIGGGMGLLRRDGVFFEPASEIYYYEALGHRALAERLMGDEKAEALRATLRSWRTYLALAAADDPWRELVEQRAEEARVELETETARRTSRRRARPSQQ